MQINQAVAALLALAQDSRLRIFRLLVPTGTDGLAAGAIAEQLDISPTTLTFHLKELVHAGLVESRREGRSIIYSLRVDGMRDLLTFLVKDCCKGHPELCCPVSVAECSTGPKKRRRKAART